MPAPLLPSVCDRAPARPRALHAGLLACVALLLLGACGAEARRVRQALAHENAQLAHAALPEQAHASLLRAALAADALHVAAVQLSRGENATARPLLTTREAWISARSAWVQALPFSALARTLLPDAPLADPDLPLPDPSWFDAIEGDADAGIISDPARLLAADVFRTAQQQTPHRARMGWEAVAFLLFGEDTQDAYHGARPLEDFHPASAVGEHVERRLLALRLQTELLRDLVAQHADLWAPEGHARTAFAQADAAVVLPLFARVAQELISARVTRALPLDDEDAASESSAFADANRSDLLALSQGLKAVQRGAEEKEISGAGLQLVTQRIDDQLAMAVVRALDDAARKTRELPEHYDATLEPGESEAVQRDAAAKAWRAARFQLGLQAELFELGQPGAPE